MEIEGSSEETNQEKYPLTSKEQHVLGMSRRITRSQTYPQWKVLPSPLDSPISLSSKTFVASEDSVKKIYLNNNVKLVHKNLETIFEDPVLRKGNVTFIGNGKQKRSLHLCQEFRIVNKQKSKMRKSRLRRLGRKVKLLKMSNDEFEQRMLSIDRYINEDDVNEGQNLSVDESQNVMDFEVSQVGQDEVTEMEVDDS